MSNVFDLLELPLPTWYTPNPERHYVIDQPTDRRQPPRMHVYVVCGQDGCEHRFYLHPDYRLRDLGALATAAGWHVGLGRDVRCPDHLYGRPLQLMPATLDPTETLSEKQLSEVLEGMESRPADG